MECLSTHTYCFMNGSSTNRHDHVFLAVNCGVSMGTTIEDVHHWNWQNLCICTTNVLVQWQTTGVSSSTCCSQRNSQSSVCTEVGLEWCTIQVKHSLIDSCLIEYVQTENLWSDLFVYVSNSL